MKILSVGSAYKPNNGGNAKRVSVMCEHFSNSGHKVIIITTSHKENFDEEKYHAMTGISVLRFNSISSYLIRLNRIIKTHEVDIVYTHNIIAWIFCSIFLRKSKILVNEVHALNKSTRFKEYFKKVFLTSMRKNTNSVFVLSSNAKKILVEKYKFDESIIHFTPNGVDNKRINDWEFGSRRKFTFAYGGTLYDWQGINILLSTAKEILNIADDIIIKIIGGGPLYQKVRNYVNKENLEDRIYITGFLNEENYIDEVNSVDVLLIPRPSVLATESAIPLKIFDAIRANKPIIMSNVSGLTEVLNESEALIFQHDKPNQLIACCKKIYRNDSLAQQISKAAQYRIATWPTNIEIAEKQIKVMEELLKP